MRPSDTSPEAHEIQKRVWRRLGPAGRIALAVRMSEDLRDVTRAGIRQRHPAYTSDEVELALRMLLWGEAMFVRIYPTTPVPVP